MTEFRKCAYIDAWQQPASKSHLCMTSCTVHRISRVRHHSRMAKRARISIVVILGLLLLAIALLIPAFIRARSTSSFIPCVNNLVHIDQAKNQWALEHHKTSQDTPTWADIRSYLHWPSNSIPICPDGGTYILSPVGTSPKCSLGDTQTNEGRRHWIP